MEQEKPARDPGRAGGHGARVKRAARVISRPVRVDRALQRALRSTRSERVRRVHRWVGGLSAAFVLSLALTGFLLNHPEFFGQEATKVLTLAADPADGDHLYRGTEGALEQSFDGGRTWEEVPMLFPAEGAVDVAFVPGAPERVYVVLEELGLIRSDDGGIVWERVGLGFVPIVEGVRLEALAVGPEERLTLWTSRGLLASPDGGRSWEPVGDASPTGADLYTLVHQIHSGYYFASWFRYVHDAAAWGLVFLVVSGFAIWRRRNGRTGTARTIPSGDRSGREEGRRASGEGADGPGPGVSA